MALLGRFPLAGYAFAAGAIGTAVVMRLVLKPMLQDQPALVIFTLSILVTAKLCGRAPGVFATLLSAAAAAYLFIDASTVEGFVHLALFTVMGTGVAALGGDIRKERIASARSEQTTRALLETAPQAMVAVGAHGRIVLVNGMAERVFGYSREELLGAPLEMLLPQSQRQQHVSHREMYNANPRTRPMGSGIDLVAANKDGSEFPVEVSLSTLQTTAGPLTVSFIIDITERKRAEEALRESEDTLRTLLESAAQAIIGINSDGRILLVNAMAERMFGYSRAELLGNQLETLLPEGLRERHREHRAAYNANPHNRPMGLGLELSARCKDGTEFPVEVSLSTFETPRGRLAVSFVTDISERKQAEKSLHEKNQRLQELTRALDLAPCVILTPDGEITYWSQGAALLYGWSPGEAIGRKAHDLLKSELSEPLSEIQASLAQNGFWEGELRHTHKDGSPVIVASHWALHRNEHGQPTAIVEVNSDVTERKLASEALRQANQERQRYLAQFEAVVDHLTEGLVVSDLDGHVFYWNPAAIALHGFSSLEECTRRLSEFSRTFELWTAEDGVLPVDQWPLARILRGETLRAWEVNIRRHGTDWQRVFNYGGTLVRSQDGDSLLAIVTVTDVTARKQAAEALKERQEDLNRAQAVSHTGSWRRHVGKDHLEWSDETYRIFGISPETSLTYDLFAAAIHPDDREFVQRSAQSWRAGGLYDIEHRIIVDGKVKWVRERAELELDEKGSTIGAFGTVQDITDRKHAEEEVRQLNAELEQRVQDRTTQLEAANRELEAFAYSVSHDLRAPLRGIDGWSLALLEDYGEQLDARARQYLDRVRSETQRMGMLIDDLLQLSRVTRMQMQLDPVDMSGLVEEIGLRLKESYSNRHIEFIVQPGLTASGDPRLLEIALTNLLGNAAKFTGPRPLARIQFGQLPDTDPAVFYVRDNGVGFDMAYAGTLFGAFQRLHKPSQFPGTGIGLATVQRVIRRHGGHVWAEAEPGEGATFYFHL